MKFDYCIGNPPYQDPKVGSTAQLWFNFLQATKNLADTKCMIHPGRWVIPTKAYEKYRESILKDMNCTSFKYFPKSGEVFSGVAIDGGITITFFNKSNEPTKYYVKDEYKGIYQSNIKVFSSNLEEECFNKVFKNIDISLNMEQLLCCNFTALGHHSYAHIKDGNINLLKDDTNSLTAPIKIWISKSTGRGDAKYKWYYIDKSYLVDIDESIFKTRKVMLDTKGHAIAHGKGNVINNLPQICNKNQIGYGVYFIIPKNDVERELQLIKSLFMTKTARYLMCITQKSLYVRGFENIPDYLELAKLLPEDQLFSDEWFYKTFDFSKELINDIETRVSEKVDKEA